MSIGTSHIKFCEYDPENFPYPDYCQCKGFIELTDNDDLSNSNEQDTNESDGEVPF